MIISRTLAKSRIRRGIRPGWLTAWGPVLLDFAIFAGLWVLVWWLVSSFIPVEQPLSVAMYLVIFALVFVPMQVVLIMSSLWATRSRFAEDPGNG